jgi:hypothetical protein
MPYDSESRVIDAELAERQIQAGKIDPDVRQWILRDLDAMMPRLEAKSAQQA